MPHLSICALGPLVVTLDGQPITEQAYDKVWALLVYLAQAPDHPHRREHLAGLLWPDQREERALTNLRQALSRLRRAIGDADATPSFLLVDRTRVQFNAASDTTMDVTEFKALLAACASHAHRHDTSCAACAEWREQAVALYRGAFLDTFYIGDSDLFEEWATVAREPLHQQAMDALAALVAYHERRGNYVEALHCGERQLALEPWREEAYRQIMRLLELNGQRSAALHWYARCCTMLEVELGVSPAAETTTLYEQIRAAEGEGSVKTDYLVPPTKRRHNLPLPPTPFLGRQEELATLADLLADAACRLITLLGPGGMGKTRLALQAASDEGELFADGTFFVNLAPLNTTEHLVHAVTSALNFTLANHAPPLTELLHYLRQKEMLLILDNFEHLLARGARTPADNGNGSATDLVTAILQHAAGVTILVTSRERLHLQGEWVFDVGGLETPAEAWPASEERNGKIETFSAVALFLQTARRVQQGFDPAEDDRAALVQICHLVQGMPLALEVAAAWVRVLSCREIADEIEQSLGFLTTTLRDLPERHHSLQAVFDHSWKLLSAEEQHVFACCSVFRGGFTREAAAAVAGATLTNLAALVDKSLLCRDLKGRYEVHELARQYAAARLADAQEETQARHRHLAFFMRFAETAEPEIFRGEQNLQWHVWVAIEHDNLRAALEWSLTSGEIESGLRIAAALWEFWMIHGHAPEGQTHAERLLARPEAAARTLLRARTAHTAGVCAFYHGHNSVALAWLTEAADIGRELGARGAFVRATGLIGLGYTHISLQEFDVVQTLCQETLSIGEELQDDYLKAHALNQFGISALQGRDVSAARNYLLASLALFQAVGQNVMRGPVLMRLGTILCIQGDYVAAERYLRKSLAICEELDDKLRSSSTLTQWGYLAQARGNNREAEELLIKAVTLTRETGHLVNRINPLNALGWLAQRLGDNERAYALHQEALASCIEIKLPIRFAHTLDAFASLAARQGQAEAAARLFGATDTYLAATNMSLASTQIHFDPLWRQEHDHLVDLARTQLGEDAFAATWAAGAAMTLDEAMAFVGTQQWN